MNKTNKTDQQISLSKTFTAKKHTKDKTIDPDSQKQKATVQLEIESQKKALKLFVNLHTNFQQLKIVLKKAVHEKIKVKEKIVGFQSIEGDECLDYRLQIGEGIIIGNMNLRCIFENKKAQGIEKYKICKCLAIGGFSKVFLVRSKINGEFYAAKFIEKHKNQSQEKKKLIQNQKVVGSIIDHPFLVKTHEFIETPQFYILVMDYCPGGELFYLLKKRHYFNQGQAKFCFIEILLGLEELHSRGYMFRDLKPQNIILDRSGHIKIADFGLAKPYKDKSYSFCGSLQYMAPQIIIGNGHSKFIDYYCLGALLYQMLIGHPPFYSQGLDPIQTKLRILNDPVLFPEQPEISTQAKDIIKKLLIKKQSLRLGYLGGSRQIFFHPWIGKINREKYLKREVDSPFYVNLKISNFDPDQIGQSERNFQNKIDEQVKKMRKERSCRKLVKKQTRKFSYESTHDLKSKSPYQPRSSFRNSLNKSSKSQLAPYYTRLIKNSSNLSKLYRPIKTQQKEEHQSPKKHKLLTNIRFTQTQKENTLGMYNQSKIKRKCKNNHKTIKMLPRC